MAINPSFSFMFLSLFTSFSATLVSSSTFIPYSQHCASVVPESAPTTPSTTTFPYRSQVLTHYTGGDKILNRNISSKSFSLSGNYFWFFLSKEIFETNTSGVYKIKAFLTFQSSGSYSPRNHRRGDRLTFAFEGFWSRHFEKLCMVGSASFYLDTGSLINLDAVLKLKYAMNLTIFTGLVTGKMESLASPKDPIFFEPVSLLEYASSSDYQYSLVSGQFDRDCHGGLDILKIRSLGLQPEFFCNIMKSREDEVFNLEYLSECGSLKNCNPLGKVEKDKLPREMMLNVIECSAEKRERKVQYMIIFVSGYNQSHAFDPTTTLVGEGSWDEKKNQLCIVACRFLNSTDSLDNAQVGDCSIRLSIRYPAFWTIKSKVSILGEIWTNKTADEPGYFNRIMFRSRYNNMASVPGVRYKYTFTEKVRKLCPFNKSVINKGSRYPKWNSNDLSFGMSVRDSKGHRSWSYATPIFIDDQNIMLHPGAISTPMHGVANIEGKSYHRPLNITYTISPHRPSSNALITSHITLTISAEGLYDEETGSACMVGCRKLSTGESMDCELLLQFQFPPINAKKGWQISGSIESTREETDPLYFKPMEITGMPSYREEARRSVKRLDLEIVMVLISNTLACVFVVLQIFYVKRNPQVLPFVSQVMLLLLTLGHMIPLVLNFGALFLGDRNQRNVLLWGGGWVGVNEVIMRVTKLGAFLLQLRLLQLAFSARRGDENGKGLWVAEKRAVFVSLPVYILGLLVVLAFSSSSTSFVVYDMHSLWRGLRRYSGLVLDGFLLPQILLNIFQITPEKALSRPFYIGTTCVRLLARAYDLYRTHHNARSSLKGAYFFANPDADFFSVAWDIDTTCGCVLFAIVIYLQQRFGGLCMFPRVQAYEKVPVISSDQ